MVATEERIFVSIDDEPPQILNLHDVKGIFGGVKPSYLGPPESKRLNYWGVQQLLVFHSHSMNWAVANLSYEEQL